MSADLHSQSQPQPQQPANYDSTAAPGDGRHNYGSTATAGTAGTAGGFMPSDKVEPSRVVTEPQQASTSPGDGSTVEYVEQPGGGGGKIPWKDQVLGYAKEIRGTVLRKPDTKAHGEKILEGQTSPQDPPPPVEKD